MIFRFNSGVRTGTNFEILEEKNGPPMFFSQIKNIFEFTVQFET